MIEILNLSKQFGAVAVVNDISFSVQRGEVLGFLGPNGAGKSTTMRMITGFLTPDSGRVLIDGIDIREKPLAVKRKLGYLPEGTPLYSDMTPRGFLAFIAEVRGWRGRKRNQKIDEVVEKINLYGVMEEPIKTLSKGYKRRVGLAQAILHDPEILILDEPTDGLDPNQKHDIRKLIRSMSADKVIILSTHILEEVEAVCSRAVVITKGKLVSDGTPDELAARSRLHNALRLTVRGSSAENLSSMLEQLDAVRRVQVLNTDPNQTSLRIFAAGEAALSAPISEFAYKQGWSVQELYVERGRLDEVFRQITITGDRAQ